MKTPRWIVWATGLAAAISGAQAETVNGIKAIVHDSVITYDEVQGMVASEVQYLQRKYRNDLPTLEAKLSEVGTNSLEQLLQSQLILRDFAEAGYALPESFVDEAVEERLRDKFGGDRAKFAKTLQADGITFEKYRQQIREQITVQILRSKNVAQEIIMSPHKIEKYYLEHRDKYQVEDEVKLRMIVLNKPTQADAERVHKLAEEILAKLKEGAAFAEMASVYSQGSQRSQGGDWGWVEKSVLKKELGEVAFKLKAGERSDIIDLPEACYLMLVEDARPAHTRPLSELREEIERTLLVTERKRLDDRYIQKLKAKTFVRYF